MIFDVIKTILINNGSSNEEGDITAYNILKGFRKFPKRDKISVLNLINKLKIAVCDE